MLFEQLSCLFSFWVIRLFILGVCLPQNPVFRGCVRGLELQILNCSLFMLLYLGELYIL